MSEVMSYNQFAAKHHLVTDYDVQGHIHAGLMAAHMPNSYHRRYKKRLAELQEARAEGQRLYQEAIESGEVSQPKEPTYRERLEARANGDPDMASTQAAIRTLARLKARTEQGDAPVLFGLEAQGHIQTVETALSEGADWQEIGRRIGWDGETAKQYYERHVSAK